MLALIGLATPGMEGRFAGVPDEALLRYAQLLQELARFYLRDGLDFEVRLVRLAAEVPAPRLSRPGGPRLGWDAWLSRRDRDADDARFRPRSA